MTVTVAYTTQLKAALGMASEQIELDSPAAVSDLLQALRDRHQAAFADLVFGADNQLLPSVLLCVGDDQIDPNKHHPLKDGDVVTLLSAISGG
jgi:molybdopterin converting factor small subunit